MTYVGIHCVCTVFVLICTDIYSVQLEYSIVGWPRDLCGITQGSRAKDYQGSPYKAATGATHKQCPLKKLHTNIDTCTNIEQAANVYFCLSLNEFQGSAVTHIRSYYRAVAKKLSKLRRNAICVQFSF